MYTTMQVTASASQVDSSMPVVRRTTGYDSTGGRVKIKTPRRSVV